MNYSKTLEFVTPTINIDKIRVGIVNELSASGEFKESFILLVAQNVASFLEEVADYTNPDATGVLEMSETVRDEFSDRLDDFIEELPSKFDPYQKALALAFLLDLKIYIKNIVEYGADFYS